MLPPSWLQTKRSIFTSGGTESDEPRGFCAARALKSKGRHLITSAVEHHAVLNCFEYLAKNEGFELTLLPVDQDGVVSAIALEKALRPETILVSIMAAKNEIGISSTRSRTRDDMS